jgi:hypothetical protein
MKTQKTRNLVLALTGLLALSIYILACTSFSPDDTKVLYPAFDTASGAVGMAVYDREARRSEMLFVPIAFDAAQSNAVAPTLARAEWLGDGRQIVIAWAGGKDGEDLHLALIPWGARVPIRLFHLPGLKDSAFTLVTPLCLVGERVFFTAAPKGVVRIDLNTGELARHEFADARQDVALYPAPGGAGVFYIEEQEPPGKGVTFGRLNPDDFSRTPLSVITNEIADKSFFAYDKEGNTVAFPEHVGGAERLVVLRQGKPIFTRSLGAAGEELAFGNAGFSFKGDALWATFQKKLKGTNQVAYGLVEIPLSDAPLRETILIPAAEASDDASTFYFQAAVSHDGKTAAIATTYLACASKEFKPEDCALFFVDLSDPNRKVTKVPLPLPAKPVTPATK